VDDWLRACLDDDGDGDDGTGTDDDVGAGAGAGDADSAAVDDANRVGCPSILAG